MSLHGERAPLRGWRNAMHLQMLANLAEVCREQLRPRGTGRMVARLEEAFARYVGAKHAIAMTNGTVTLQVAIEAMGWTAAHPDTPEAYFHVAVPPLTMSATTAAVVAARGTPYFVDVEPDTWMLGGIPDDVPRGSNSRNRVSLLVRRTRRRSHRS
jgi:dTDP-4-amino-4,6-dideoxygalactose transaminase